MSNLLELLSLNELNIRRNNLLKQINKVDIEIKQRNKDFLKNQKSLEKEEVSKKEIVHENQECNIVENNTKKIKITIKKINK